MDTDVAGVDSVVEVEMFRRQPIAVPPDASTRRPSVIVSSEPPAKGALT
jgi:hypothetical protein